jgi:hypothetical protein
MSKSKVYKIAIGINIHQVRNASLAEINRTKEKITALNGKRE